MCTDTALLSKKGRLSVAGALRVMGGWAMRDVNRCGRLGVISYLPLCYSWEATSRLSWGEVAGRVITASDIIGPFCLNFQMAIN